MLKNRVIVSHRVSPGLLSLAKGVAIGIPIAMVLGSSLSAQSPPVIVVLKTPIEFVWRCERRTSAAEAGTEEKDLTARLKPCPDETRSFFGDSTAGSLAQDQSGNSQAAAPQAPPAATSGAQAPSSSPSDTTPTNAAPTDDPSGGQQTKRILGIVPNFQAVSANTNLPPLTLKQKFWLATQGTFDYSSFISVAMQAAIEQATNTYPEFHQGAAGYGRYYWHTFADAGIENYMTGAILPAITHEDPRYYTLYHGSFFRRTGYAISRLWITKSDKGAARFNISEIVGSGVATEISSRYYPRGERQGAGETMERWASQVLNDGVGNVFEEFWPDIHQKLFRGR